MERLRIIASAYNQQTIKTQKRKVNKKKEETRNKKQETRAKDVELFCFFASLVFCSSELLGKKRRKKKNNSKNCTQLSTRS